MSPRLAVRLAVPLFAAGVLAGLAGCSSGDDLDLDIDTAPAEEPQVEEKDMREAHREEFVRRSKGKVVVVVLKDNRTWLNGGRISPKKLPAKLAEIGRLHPGMPVLFASQVGTDPQAGAFVELHAGKAGLGPVEYFN